MHPMQSYINLYIISYISLCIYVSMHPMQMIKLVFNSNGLISSQRVSFIFFCTELVAYRQEIININIFFYVAPFIHENNYSKFSFTTININI